MAQVVKNLPATQETRVWSLSWEDPLEKGTATHSSILAWRIPWTNSMGHKGSDTSKWFSLSKILLFKCIWVSANEVDETRAYYTEWNESQGEKQILYGVVCMGYFSHYSTSSQVWDRRDQERENMENTNLLFPFLCESLWHVQLFVTAWTVAHQASLSMGFFRPETGVISMPSRRSSQCGDWTHISYAFCIGRRVLYH